MGRSPFTTLDQSPFLVWGFSTELGWMAVATDGERVTGLSFGHRDRNGAIGALQGQSPAVVDRPARSFRTWQGILERFAKGRCVDLCEIPVEMAAASTFTGRVQRACRKIAWGQTRKYCELAGQAGSPRAARAVGNVMRSNRIPLLIPCHRVVGSSGLGGYSAAGGVAIKRQLLDLERAGVPEG